jgi:hypothetical protein
MVLAEMNGINVVTIDNNVKAVKRANEVIKRKNLNEKIRVKYGKGTSYHLDGFDTIIVSGCSIPKIKVLEHVLKNANSKSNIIARVTPDDIDKIKNKLDKKIKIVKKIKNNPFPNSSWNSYLFKKD